MSYGFRAALWFGAYFLLVILPLIAGAIAPPEAAGRGILYELSIALGYSGLAMLALEFLLIARVRTVAAAFGNDALLQFHQLMGYASFGLIVAHPALLIHEALPVAVLNPFDDSTPRMWRSGVISFWCLLGLVLKATLRRRLRLEYEWWKFFHSLLATATVLLGLAHIFMVDTYTNMPAVRLIWYGYVLLLLITAVRYRVVRPLKMWREPWEVARNVVEAENTRTLWLRPIGHGGMQFEPGQFAWLATGRTPFSLEQHPVSISSSAERSPARSLEPGVDRSEVAFTIKAFGDWSGNLVPRLRPGDRVWVDGPYGAFTPDREQGPGFVLIGGGIGITPLVSMCLTLAEREDARPLILFYCAREEADLAFHQVLDKLSRLPNIQVIYLLEHPSPHWPGEQGHLTREILERYLPRQYRRYQFFICGPPQLMNAMEKVLPMLGVPSSQVHTERFGLI